MADPSPLAGMLERADRETISGWARDPERPDEAVSLELLIDGMVAGILPAGALRADLAAAGLGTGRHGFSLHLPEGFAGGCVIRLRHADGRELPGSPLTIEAVEGAEAAAQDRIAAELEIEGPAAIGRLAEAAAALLFARGGAPSEPELAFLARHARHPALLDQVDDRKRALFIDEGVPDGRRDAGSNAAISHMRALLRLGYRVDFVAGYGLEPGGERTAALIALGITCWHAPWVGSVEEVLRRLGEGLDLAYLHRFGVMQRYGALVRRWCPRAELLYCVADLHFLRMARQEAVQAGLALDGASLSAATDGLRTAELLAVLGADAAITHSSFEAALLRREAPEAAVHLAAWDVAPRPVVAGFEERRGVGFIGSYGHAPNLDAAHMLVSGVMPLVWAVDPEIPCLLAGSGFPHSLRAAAEAAPEGRVIVLGEVGDAAELWERVRLSAAALRFGAGLKGKVLDSLAAGIPCVCAPMAAEGMDLPLELAETVCATPAAMAETILRLHGDAAANARLAAAGLAWVGATLSEDRIDLALASAIGRK